MSDFSLDSRLAADCAAVGDWPLCRLLLMLDARYPWFILVPRRMGLREICELDEDDASQLLSESRQLSRFMLEDLEVEKLNVAALGNVVPQLHLHHVGRRVGDDAWPGPVWGAHPPLPYGEAALRRRIEQARRALNGLTVTPPAPH